MYIAAQTGTKSHRTAFPQTSTAPLYSQNQTQSSLPLKLNLYTMTFTIKPANDADIEKIITITLESYFGTDEYINAVFPRGLTEEGQKFSVERMLFINSVAPTVFWEKAIDSDTGDIVGGAMWNLCENEKPPPYEMDGPPGTWETEAEKRYAQALQRSLVEDESKLWADNELPLLGMSALLSC